MFSHPPSNGHVDLTSSLKPPPFVGGTSITITATTRNQGPDDARASVTAFFLSRNTIVDAGDVLLGYRQVPPLGAGESYNATAALTIPTNVASGAYNILAVADASSVVVEYFETNNTSKAVPVNVLWPFGLVP